MKFYRKETFMPTNMDLNTATENELTAVQGITKEHARKILEHRTQNGSFKSFDDLKRIPGIAGYMLESLKRQGFTVGGKAA